MTRTAVVCGLGGHVPPTVVTNADLERSLDVTDEWIRRRVGVGRRHVAEAGTATSDLAAEAASRALKSAGLTAVDAVVLATSTPDRPCPGTAPSVASLLGLDGVAAFDVAAVCTGFLYALATGGGLIASGVAEHVLVIGADTFSTILHPADGTTRAIFGDGAGAVVLRAGEAGEPGALGPFDLASDGGGADLIMVESGGSRRRALGPDDPTAYFSMAGQPVYRQAVARMTGSSRKVLEAAGWSADSVDRVVCHQANIRILQAVCTQLGVPFERCVHNIEHVGNTAAASIPLALAHGTLHPGDRVLLTAFGGGLTWGSTTLTWPDVTAIA